MKATFAWSELLQYSELKHLDISYSYISGDCVEYFEKCPHLESLGLRQIRVTDAELQTLTRLTCLELLDLRYNDYVTKDTALMLATRLPRLRTLDIGLCGNICFRGFRVTAKHDALVESVKAFVRG